MKTIILAEIIKLKKDGTPLKNQPIHPAVKFEKLLKIQNIPFTKSLKKYKDTDLMINETSGFYNQKIEDHLFNCTTEPETFVFEFNY